MAGEALYTGNMLRALGASSSFGFALAAFYLLPKFLVDDLGAGAADVGLVTSAFGMATVVGAPLVGMWVDRVARRYLISVASLVMTFASLTFTLVDDLGPMLYLLRAVQGLCFAVVLTSVGAMITELSPPERLSEALGLAGASMLIMSAVGPPIVEPLASAAGWTPVFILAAGAAALGAMLALTVREPCRHGARDGEASQWLRAALRSRRFRHYAAITASIGAAFGVMFTFQQPFVMELGRVDVGGFFVAYSLVAIAVRVGAGGLPDRLGRHRVAVFAINVYAAVVLATAALRPGMLEVTGALLGLAHGLFFPAFNALVIGAAPPSERGKAFAVFTGAFYGGLAIGVVGFGFLAEGAGYPAVFIGAGSLTAAAAALLVLSPEFRADD
ncbi:MAG: MFS transporter [Candidatus Binatia bacterium]